MYLFAHTSLRVTVSVANPDEHLRFQSFFFLLFLFLVGVFVLVTANPNGAKLLLLGCCAGLQSISVCLAARKELYVNKDAGFAIQAQ